MRFSRLNFQAWLHSVVAEQCFEEKDKDDSCVRASVVKSALHFIAMESSQIALAAAWSVVFRGGPMASYETERIDDPYSRLIGRDFRDSVVRGSIL